MDAPTTADAISIPTPPVSVVDVGAPLPLPLPPPPFVLPVTVDGVDDVVTVVLG